MPERPLVSVIIPVYNAERFLPRCIDSVLGQTCRGLEVILVDDGSDDGSAAACDHYAKIDGRVQACHQRNSGPSSARNLGLDHARGRYVMFVDADDFIDPEMAAALVDAMQAHDAGMAVCAFASHVFAGQQELATGSLPLRSQRSSVEEFLSLATLDISDPQAVCGRAHFAGGIWGRLYRMDVIKAGGLRFDAALTRYEDILFNVSYLTYIDSIMVLDERLYHYCVYGDHVSLSDRVPRNKFDMALAAYEKIRRRLGPRRSDYILYYFSYIVMGYLIRLFQEGSPFTFIEAWREVKAVSITPMYREVMAFYRRREGGSVLFPFFLRARMHLLASAVAKTRMLKASLSHQPVRRWCFPSAPAGK